MANNNTSAADHFAILDAAVAIGSEGDVDAVGRRAIAELARLIPSTVVTLNEVDASAGRFRFWTEPAGFTFPPAVGAAWEELATENPLIARHQRTGDGSAHRFSDVWTVDEYHASELYRRVYEPMGIEHQLAFAIPEPLPVVIGVVMSRGGPDYSERDRQVANLLRPHIAHAWRNARELELLRSGRPSPIDGDRRVRTGPPDDVREWLAAERRRLAVASPDATSPTPDPWGLTPREAEVFRLLTTGATNVSIARSLGISSDTVKRHLSRVYRKTGVSGRVRAALFAMENIDSTQP